MLYAKFFCFYPEVYDNLKNYAFNTLFEFSDQIRIVLIYIRH